MNFFNKTIKTLRFNAPFSRKLSKTNFLLVESFFVAFKHKNKNSIF